MRLGSCARQGVDERLGVNEWPTVHRLTPNTIAKFMESTRRVVS